MNYPLTGSEPGIYDYRIHAPGRNKNKNSQLIRELGMRHTILVLNAKGGCGKTTIATNLASYYAGSGVQTAMLDYDPQGSSTKWNRIRGDDRPLIHAIAAFRETRSASVTRSWQLTPPADTERVVIDAPAGVYGFHLQDYVRLVDTILIPVLPSSFDMYAASDFIRDLLLVGRARVHKTRLAVVANRVRERTNSYHTLRNFLRTLNIPFIAALRDSQNYVRAAEEGIGIHDLPGHLVQRDVEQWQPLLQWLERGVMREIESAGSSRP